MSARIFFLEITHSRDWMPNAKLGKIFMELIEWKCGSVDSLVLCSQNYIKSEIFLL